MRSKLPAVVSAVVSTIVLLASCFTAAAVNGFARENGIIFGAYCDSTDEAARAISAGAAFITPSEKADVNAFVGLASDDVALVLDAADIAAADAFYDEYNAGIRDGSIVLRLHFGAKKASDWFNSKGGDFKIICAYTGNVYFSAVGLIARCAEDGLTDTVQLSSKNPYGVITHNTVLGQLDKKGVRGMFSFADKSLSAGRTDDSRSWDDLISRGYSVIETRFPEDFAEYLKDNENLRAELVNALKTAEGTATEGCHKNRIKELDKAVSEARALLKDGSVSSLQAANAKSALYDAVRDLTLRDKDTLRGDFAVTPARLGGAIFGVALVIGWQVYFSAHRKKKDTAVK